MDLIKDNWIGGVGQCTETLTLDVNEKENRFRYIFLSPLIGWSKVTLSYCLNLKCLIFKF